MARMTKFILLVTFAAFFGGIPAIAVIGHHHFVEVHHPVISEPVHRPDRLVIMSQEGNRIAVCEGRDNDGDLHGCRIDDGYTLDDLMNAWVSANQDLQESKQ